MKVLLFHPSLLPPRDYGGVERVVLWLAKGLVERGHEVTVAAFAGSRLPAGVKLREVAPEQASAAALLERLPAGIEVVHFMAPPEAGVWPRLPCAGLLTVHGNGKAGELFPKNTVFLSRDHAERHGATEFVHNGIDPAEYVFDPGAKDDAFVFLSKTSWRVKNLGGAIRLCGRAGARLRVAGGQRPLLARARVLLNPRMSWVGPVAGADKARLLARARALVFPVLWPEPFGLVVAEALMSGTPVIASRKGSLRELVPADVGAILDPEREADAWVDLLRSPVLPWRPERCREWALEKFHYSRMAESYERFYRRVAAGDVIQEKEPQAAEWREQ